MKNFQLKKMAYLLVALIGLNLVFIPSIQAQNKVTSPQEHFGYDIGADYHLINYTQIVF